MTSKTKTYKDVEIKEYSDLVAEPQYDLFFNNGNNERQEEGTLTQLAAFSSHGMPNS